jgi:hypothetical protein
LLCTALLTRAIESSFSSRLQIVVTIKMSLVAFTSS